MRILHVLDHSIPLHSGYTFRTAAILREQRALGWETFHLTSPKQGKTGAPVEDVDGLRFHRSEVPPPGPAGLNEWRLIRATEARLLQLARELRPDVIHAHSPVLNAIPAIRVGRKLGIPVVYEIRAFWEDAAVDHGTTSEGSLRYRATRALETWAIKRVDHVFTICEGLRRDILARGIAESKVTVIPNAVDAVADLDAAVVRPAGRAVVGFGVTARALRVDAHARRDGGRQSQKLAQYRLSAGLGEAVVRGRRAGAVGTAAERDLARLGQPRRYLAQRRAGARPQLRACEREVHGDLLEGRRLWCLGGDRSDGRRSTLFELDVGTSRQGGRCRRGRGCGLHSGRCQGLGRALRAGVAAAQCECRSVAMSPLRQLCQCDGRCRCGRSDRRGRCRRARRDGQA